MVRYRDLSNTIVRHTKHHEERIERIERTWESLISQWDRVTLFWGALVPQKWVVVQTRYQSYNFEGIYVIREVSFEWFSCLGFCLNSCILVRVVQKCSEVFECVQSKQEQLMAAQLKADNGKEATQPTQPTHSSSESVMGSSLVIDVVQGCFSDQI